MFKSLKKLLTGKEPPLQVSRPENVGREEWVLLENVVKDAFSEQKRARQWGTFFKLLTFAYILFAFVLFTVGKNGQSGGGWLSSGADGHTALVRVTGVIAEDGETSANMFAAGLRKAFEHSGTRAVIIAINSPGGSPVQSDYMYTEIRRLREENPDIALYAVISDIGASGGYYVAAAADEIYANPASLVGSIGVTSAGFGFVGTIDKLGIERRDYTAGENKSFLDPFQPSKPDQVEFWRSVLDKVHRQFVTRVRDGRGERLKETEDMFSGLIWSGEQAMELGLIDGFASAGSLARDVIGVEDVRDFTVQPTPLQELLYGMKAMKTALAVALDQRASVTQYPELIF
jgi:protease-4